MKGDNNTLLTNIAKLTVCPDQSNGIKVKKSNAELALTSD